MRFLASEITREQLFMQLHEELPYNLTVESESWENLPDGSAKINQVIIVSKQNYKAMILGNQGARIKNIGMKSREEITKTLGMKVHLFLFVKVREDWDSNPMSYEYMNLKL
jgi:GTP-binding protein Era